LEIEILLVGFSFTSTTKNNLHFEQKRYIYSRMLKSVRKKKIDNKPERESLQK
jgi:hypothetical protein